jgi:hypothetical protein
MTRVLDHSMPEQQAVIFGDKVSPGLTCTGISYEILPVVQREGWVCLAARAMDKLGNIGVSRPLRVCLDDGISGNGVPNCSTTPPPSCMGDCTAPRKFAPVSQFGVGVIERTQ